MASGGSSGSGGTCSRSSGGSEEYADVQIMMDQKKRKRMISNRESARRSRMKKQKHINELTAEIARFQNESNQIITAINATAQLYLNIEAENSVLRAQVAELSHRLHSLNEIIDISTSASVAAVGGGGGGGFWGAPTQVSSEPSHDAFFNSTSWNQAFDNYQLPLMASVDIFDY